MKKTALVLFLILVQQIVFAQKDFAGYAGVYVTKEDFVGNHLSYKINTGENGCKLGFPAIADWALTIKIVTPENVYKFPSGTVYGYYENGKVYRYAPGDKMYVSEDYYRIEDDRGLVIYTSEFNGGNEYFYSINLTSPIQLLNLKNLKRDFIMYPRFIAAIARLNKRKVHGELAKRDGHGNYIVNKIYREHIKNRESYH